MTADRSPLGDSGDKPDVSAVEVVNLEGRSPVVLLCEHASAYIPPRYDRLGLSAADAARHIAWDIGAADVTRALAAAIDAPAFLGTHSRLLIDLNRPPDALINGSGVPGSIPAASEDTVIPGNVGISETEVGWRRAHLFDPFHARVSAHLDARARERRATCIVTIHSFTPVYRGERRPWHFGILFDRSETMAMTVMRRLKADPTLIGEANVPYVITHDADYAIPIHGQARGLDAILVEIRQDLIDRPSCARGWADRLALALSSSSPSAG
jgi:predicted N-formylglutamate amidohydrolase